MTTKKDFTPDEWNALHRGATGSGMLVSITDRDFTDSFGEAGAMAKYLAGQQTAGATELMRDIARQGGTGFGLTTNSEKMRTETMAAIATALATLQSKAPEELEPYKALVLGLTTAVAEAKGGGTSSLEAQMIGEIKTALGA